MSILQIFNSRIEKHGSFEDFMIELAKTAKEKNTKLGFVFPNVDTQEVKEKIEALGAKIYIIRDNWSSFKFAKKLLKVILKEKSQVLDFHFCYSLNFVFLFLILRLLRIKVIYHYHGEIAPVEELKFINRHFSKLRLITLFANEIICVSEANKRFLEALNINKNIYVVYNGINADNFKNRNFEGDFRKEMGFTNNELIVTSIGSLIPRKGMDVLIKAASFVIKELPQTRFIIIGGGEKGKYQKIAEDLGVKEKVIFTGLIKEYPYNILKDTDLYVSASFAESFGLSIAEAQILGIPVVATKVGGVLEVVKDGETGILVSPGNSQLLAKTIIELLANQELRKKFSQAGKKWIEEKFDLEEKVEELFKYF